VKYRARSLATAGGGEGRADTVDHVINTERTTTMRANEQEARKAWNELSDEEREHFMRFTADLVDDLIAEGYPIEKRIGPDGKPQYRALPAHRRH
jgi:hypothetical protein